MRPRLLPFFIACVLASGIRALPAQSETLIAWNVPSGDFQDAGNWKPSVAPELSSAERWEIGNSGTASVSAGQSVGCGDDLLIGRGTGSGTLLLSGNGMFTVKHILAIGHSGNDASEVVVNDEATLTIEEGALLVGQRSEGVLRVAKPAKVLVQAGNLKVGEGRNGAVDLAGSLETPVMYFGSSVASDAEQNSMLKVSPGAKLKIAKAMLFMATGKHLVHVVGSGGEFFAGSIKANVGTATFRFEPDAGGVTPVQIAGELDLASATLEVNLDGASAARGQKLELFDAGSLAGEFAEVRWLGQRKGAVKYDKGKAKIFILLEN